MGDRGARPRAEVRRHRAGRRHRARPGDDQMKSNLELPPAPSGVRSADRCPPLGGTMAPIALVFVALILPPEGGSYGSRGVGGSASRLAAAGPLFVESAAAAGLDVHPRQRRDRAVLHGRADGRRASRCSTTTTTATSTSSSCRAGPFGRQARRSSRDRAVPAVPQRSDRRAGRQADAPLHRRDRARRRWRSGPTAWAWPSATTTTTAILDLFVTVVRRRHALPQQRQRHVHRRHA